MVSLVVTVGPGAMDIYSQKLAEKLDVPKVYTDIYQKIARRLNISWLSRDALEAIREDWSFVKIVNKLNGIVHLPNQHLGRHGNFLKIPYIITVHDLIRYFDLKECGRYIHHPNHRDKFYLSLDYKGIKKAARIMADSQATKDDLIHHLGVPDDRISVVYLGVDHATFRPSLQANNFEYPYILFVGSEHPRKNLPTLLRAFKRLKEQLQFKDLKLVKVGKAGGPEADFRRQSTEVINSLNLDGEVIFTEAVSAEDLRAYYSNAKCFVLPSLYEGFGFPPLEAMACGLPTIVSHTSSLPEVVSQGALMVDPYNIDELTWAMETVLTDKDLREQLIQKGINQAKKFSWSKCARETLKVITE